MIDVGKNIQYLRESLGLNRQEFAKKVGISKGSISRYENGDRYPDNATLNAISAFLGISSEQLISVDFSNFDNIFHREIKTDEVIQLVLHVIPILKADDSITEIDYAFNHGYNLQKEFQHNCLYKTLNDDIRAKNNDLLQEAIISYWDSINTHGTLESKANMLGIILMLWPLTYDLHFSMPILKTQTLITSNTLHEQRKITLTNSNNWSSEQIEFYNLFNSIFFKMVQELKSTKYYDIADYYLAIKYMYGMVDSFCNLIMLRTIGAEMLDSLSQIGNQYAISVIEKFSDIWG